MSSSSRRRSSSSSSSSSSETNADQRERSRRLKLIWGGSGTIAGRWVLGVLCFYERPDRARDGIAISLRGVLLWCIALAIAGYFAAAGVYTAVMHRRPGGEIIGYGDVVMAPFRWSHFQELRGRQQIAGGMEKLKEQRFTEAFMLLRSGVDKYPHDRDARAVLAQFYLGGRDRTQALELLRGGLAGDYPGRSYLEGYLAFVTAGEEHELAIEAIDGALAHGDAVPAKDRRWLVQQKIKALIGADRPDEALALIDAEQQKVGRDSMLDEARVIALLDADRPDEAVSVLDTWAERDGDTGQILRLRVRALREADRVEDMQRTVESLRALSPTNPRPYVYRVVQLALAGAETEARTALDDYLFRFGANAANVQLLAEPLFEIRRPDLLQIVLQHAREQGFPLKVYHTLLVQALIAKGDWQGAKKNLDAVGPLLRKDNFVESSWHEIMTTVVAAALAPDDGTRVALVELCRSRQMPLKLFQSIVPPLVDAGRLTTARDLLHIAQKAYPSSRFVQQQVVAVDESIAEAERNRPKQAPTGPVITGAAHEVIAGLDAMLAREEWSAVITRFAEIRRARPSWLPTHEASLYERVIQAQIGAHDLIGLQGNMNYYLLGDVSRVGRLVEFARTASAQGKKDVAEIVLRTVQSKAPNDRAVQALAAELAPPPAEGQPAADPAPASEAPPAATP